MMWISAPAARCATKQKHPTGHFERLTPTHSRPTTPTQSNPTRDDVRACVRACVQRKESRKGRTIRQACRIESESEREMTRGTVFPRSKKAQSYASSHQLTEKPQSSRGRVPMVEVSACLPFSRKLHVLSMSNEIRLPAFSFFFIHSFFLFFFFD